MKRTQKKKKTIGRLRTRKNKTPKKKGTPQSPTRCNDFSPLGVSCFPVARLPRFPNYPSLLTWDIAFSWSYAKQTFLLLVTLCVMTKGTIYETPTSSLTYIRLWRHVFCARMKGQASEVDQKRKYRQTTENKKERKKDEGRKGNKRNAERKDRGEGGKGDGEKKGKSFFFFFFIWVESCARIGYDDDLQTARAISDRTSFISFSTWSPLFVLVYHFFSRLQGRVRFHPRPFCCLFMANVMDVDVLAERGSWLGSSFLFWHFAFWNLFSVSFASRREREGLVLFFFFPLLFFFLFPYLFYIRSHARFPRLLLLSPFHLPCLFRTVTSDGPCIMA